MSRAPLQKPGASGGRGLPAVRMERAGARLCVAALYIALAGVVAWAAARREPEVLLARYVTCLQGRTPNQIHNVALAVRSIHGTWIRPGAEFSFNRAVGSWSSDSGYKRAPVSYDGELVPSWGGGVCQASTTLYNAALLAGLTPVERHRHRWVAHYAAPGRDAAVAFSNIDLKLRNPFAWPVRLEGALRGDLVEFRVVGRARGADTYRIEQRIESMSEPLTLMQPWRDGMPARRVRNPGKAGCHVVTFRVRVRDGREVARELLSDDDYPAMNRLLLEDW